MKKIDLEFKILKLEERNKYLISEYRWLWEQFKRAVQCSDTVTDNIKDKIERILK